mgnify:CR=1 FL=1
MAVGHIGGKLRVFVVKLQADDAVFASGDSGVVLQFFAGVDFELFLVAVLQLKALYQAVLDAGAFEEANVLVCGVFDATGSASQAAHGAQALQQCGCRALLLLGWEELGFGGVGGGDEEADAQGQDADGQGAQDEQAQVVDDDLEQVQETDFVFWVVWLFGGGGHVGDVGGMDPGSSPG